MMKRGFAFLCLVAGFLWAFPAFATPGETLVPASGHPVITTKVSGSGFLANEAVDIYFDTTDKLLAFTDASGNFPAHDLVIPADALPGTHWITAIGRKGGDGIQKSFVVRTAWPQFGFGANGARNNPYENVISRSNVASLDLAWSQPTGGIDSFNTASPTVVNGIVYIGSTNNVLYAFTASTGVLKWSYTTGGPIYSTPAVMGGTLFIGSVDKKIYALNATTGALKWTVTTGSDIESSPAVSSGVVYIGSTDGLLYALNATTGATKWTALVGSIVSTPAVANGVVYIGSINDSVYALNAATGATLWTGLTGGPVYSSPAVANGVVSIGSDDGDFYVYNAKTGAVKLASNFGTAIELRPAVANGLIYFEAGGQLVATPQTFNALWDVNAPATNSSPCVANGIVYIGGGKSLYAYDAGSGSLLWSQRTANTINSSPVVSDGMVYVGSSNARLYAYALNGGSNAVYRTRTLSPPYASLHPDFRLKPQRRDEP